MTHFACDYPAARAVPSPNHGERASGQKPDMIILHYTGMETAQAALDWLCREESQVSATISSMRTVASISSLPRIVAPGMPARASGRARQTSIPARSASRSPMPATSADFRTFPPRRSTRSLNCVGTVANAGLSPPKGCLRTAMWPPFARWIREKNFLGNSSIPRASGTGFRRRRSAADDFSNGAIKASPSRRCRPCCPSMATELK